MRARRPSTTDPSPTGSAPRADDLRWVRLRLVADVAPVVGALAAFVVPATLVPLRGDRTRVVVIAVLVLVCGAAGLAGGRPAGLVSGLMAACALDFFQLPPYDHLGLLAPTFYLWALVLVGCGVASGTAGRRLSRADQRSDAAAGRS